MERSHGSVSRNILIAPLRRPTCVMLSSNIEQTSRLEPKPYR